jgi:hypothetical protein
MLNSGKAYNCNFQSKISSGPICSRMYRYGPVGFPGALHGCGNWPPTLGEKHRLKISETGC